MSKTSQHIIYQKENREQTLGHSYAKNSIVFSDFNVIVLRLCNQNWMNWKVDQITNGLI